MAVDNLLTRHRNLTVLAVVLFVQVLGLAVQVQRQTESGSTSLVRMWTVTIFTPVEKAVVYTKDGIRHVWRDYFALRSVRQENQALREENQRLRLEAVRLGQDANQARRLQALLGFKEQFIEETLPAQVISTTGSDFSRGIYIDKGSRDGVKADMPVITLDGIVGKVYRTYSNSSLVLEINDPSSGAGVILEKSRLQGIVKGDAAGGTLVHNIMSDEKVEVGERVLTSGGDRIFPKGMPVGVVSSITPGPDFFLTVRVKPAANLNRVEEVLVITKIVDKVPDTQDLGPRQRAADILADRLPSVPPKPPEGTPGTNGVTPGSKPPTSSTQPGAAGSPATPSAAKPPAASGPVLSTPAAKTPQNAGTTGPKPAGTTAPKSQVAAGKPPSVSSAAKAPATIIKPAATTAPASQPKVPPKTAAGVNATTGAPAAAAKPNAGTTTPRKPNASNPEEAKPSIPPPTKDAPRQ